MSWWCVSLLALACAGGLAAQEEHGFTPFQIERGEQLFISRCSICHGPDGDAIRGVDLASGKFRHADTERELMSIIHNGIAGTPMPPGNYSPPQLQSLVAYLYSMKSGSSGPKPKFPGNAARGREIFEGQGQCLNCHRVNDHGDSFLGPNLGNIGAIRRSSTLYQAMIEPNAEIRPANRTVRIIQSDGTTVLGRLLNQDTYSLQVLTAQGKLISVEKYNLRGFTIMKDSPMPNYTGKLNEQQLADVVAYLVTLKGTER